MLVVSRKKNESIVVNHDIVITLVEVRADKVRLGIVAPKEVPVHRGEVYDAIYGVELTQPSGLCDCIGKGYSCPSRSIRSGARPRSSR